VGPARLGGLVRPVASSTSESSGVALEKIRNVGIIAHIDAGGWLASCVVRLPLITASSSIVPSRKAKARGPGIAGWDRDSA
jgi:hypothetical protein